MKTKMSVGVIGCGVIGLRRAEVVRESGIGRISMVGDIDDVSAKNLAAKFGAEVANDPMAVCTSADVDTVILACPHVFLPVYAEAALTAGKHVFMEKPAAASLAQIETLKGLVPTIGTGPVCHIGYNHRFHPAAKEMYRLMQDKIYGHLLWIRGAYGHGGREGYEREWRAQPAISGGGVLIDQGSHLIDLVCWLSKEVPVVEGASLAGAFYKADGAEDNAFVQLRSPTNTWQAQLHISATQWKNKFRLEVCTTKALLIWEGLGKSSYGVETLRVFERQPSGAPVEKLLLETSADESWMNEWLAFCDAVSHYRQLTTIDDAWNAMQVIDEAHRLGRKG